MQEHEFAQEIELLIEIMDMEVGPKLWDEDVDLMPSAPHDIINTSPPLTAYPTPREEGEVVPLDYDLVMDVYNLSFDEI